MSNFTLSNAKAYVSRMEANLFEASRIEQAQIISDPDGVYARIRTNNADWKVWLECGHLYGEF